VYMLATRLRKKLQYQLHGHEVIVDLSLKVNDQVLLKTNLLHEYRHAAVRDPDM